MPRTKIEKPVRQTDKIWPVCMDAWFNFFLSKYNSKPTFIGAAAGCYKKMVGFIKQKTLDSGYEWNEKTAHENMLAFFEAAYNHSDLRFQSYIRQNFTLPNLLFHFDKISCFHGKQSPAANTFQRFADTVRTAQDRIYSTR